MSTYVCTTHHDGRALANRIDLSRSSRTKQEAVQKDADVFNATLASQASSKSKPGLRPAPRALVPTPDHSHASSPRQRRREHPEPPQPVEKGRAQSQRGSGTARTRSPRKTGNDRSRPVEKAVTAQLQQSRRRRREGSRPGHSTSNSTRQGSRPVPSNTNSMPARVRRTFQRKHIRVRLPLGTCRGLALPSSGPR